MTLLKTVKFELPFFDFLMLIIVVSLKIVRLHCIYKGVQWTLKVYMAKYLEKFASANRLLKWNILIVLYYNYYLVQ